MKNISLIIILFTFLGCTKLGKNLTVKGKVVNPITGVGIPDVTLKLQRTTLDLPGGYKTVKSTTTDANGDFEISKFGLNSYDLQCDLGDYYPIGWYEDGEKAKGTLFRLHVRKRKTMHVEFHAVEYGNLQINIKNLACFGPDDELKIFRTHSIADLYSSVPNPAIYIGCTDMVGSSYKSPMGLYTYSGTVTKNGVVTAISDSIYLNGSETKVWNIYY